MPRLTIAIVCFERTDLLEETLVSVLQHRPADSEVLVVHDGRYSDPYQIADEVRFVVPEAKHSWVSAANAAVAAARSPVVNVLAAGLQVTESWCESVLAFFNDPRVASVCPVLLRQDNQDQLVGTGVQMGWLGERCISSKNRALDRQDVNRQKAVGPNLIGAFYRRADVLSLDGLRSEFGDELGDLDLALRLRGVNVETVIDPDSQILVGEIDRPKRPAACSVGSGHQRFLQQHLRPKSAFAYWFATLGNSLLEALTLPRSPRNLAVLWGRFRELRAPTVVAPSDSLSEESLDEERAPILSMRSTRPSSVPEIASDRRAA